MKSDIKLESFVFGDLDLNIVPHPITNDLIVKVNENAVKRAIRNLLLLKKFEKPFHPEISSGIQDLLFENPSPVVYSVIKRNIEEAIKNYEPRVTGLTISFDSVPDSNALNISVKFTVANRPQTFETSILLERTR
jgi:phage baseplate assembly protein W